MLSWDCMLWMSGWLTGWAAPHWAVRSSVLHAWARCPECAKSPPLLLPPLGHHALSATITRARTELHSTEDRGGEKHTQQHTLNAKNNSQHKTTYLNTHTTTHTPFSFYKEVWYSAKGSVWLIKGLLCARKRLTRDRLILSLLYVQAHRHKHKQSDCWEWNPVSL